LHRINAGSFGTISFRAMNDLLLFAANNPAAAPLAIIHAIVRANCEPLRHLVEHQFRIHNSVHNPSATVLPAPSGFQGSGVQALTSASLSSMLQGERERGSFQWTPEPVKRTRVAPDGQQPQSESFATPPFNLSDFGDNLARGILEGVAKFQSASTQGLAKVVSTGSKYADSADTDSEEKALQRRIRAICKEQFHLLKLNDPDDQKGPIGPYVETLRRVCNDPLDSRVAIGVPGLKDMQRKADTDARASILRGDTFQRFQMSAFEDYVISKIDQHFITAQMYDPSATATTFSVLIGLNTMKLDFRLGWNACETMLRSPAYSGCLFDSSTVMRLQAVIIHNALDCMLAPSDQRANAAFGLIVTPSKTMYGEDSAGQPSGSAVHAAGSSVTQAASGMIISMGDSGNAFPNAADLIGSAFGRMKLSNCQGCQNPGHDMFECPTKFFQRTGQCMPGFDRAGNRLKRLLV